MRTLAYSWESRRNATGTMTYVMRNTEAEKRQPSHGRKHICMPFESEAQYQECVADVAKYRTYLTTCCQAFYAGRAVPSLVP